MHWLSKEAWSPYVAGVVIGLLQIPAFLLIETALGASSSYVTVGGILASWADPSILSIEYVARHVAATGKNWWQVALVIGIAIGAIGGLAVLALRGDELPHTPIDLPVIALVLAFGVATASAMNVGMSLRATAAIAAYAAMLYVALICIRYRPSWVGVVTAVPVLLLSVPTLVNLLARRIEWVVVGAPGIPPIRLAGEATPFGSVAVPPFVIWPAWALAGLIESPRWRRSVQWGLVVVGVPLTILSGSRSAWLAGNRSKKPAPP